MTSRPKAVNKIANGLNQAIGWTQGWNEACEAAANVAEQNKAADIFKDVTISRDIRALKFPRSPGERTAKDD